MNNINHFLFNATDPFGSGWASIPYHLDTHLPVADSFVNFALSSVASMCAISGLGCSLFGDREEGRILRLQGGKIALAAQILISDYVGVGLWETFPPQILTTLKIISTGVVCSSLLEINELSVRRGMNLLSRRINSVFS